MEDLFRNTIESPVGFLEIISDETSLLSISFVNNRNSSSEILPQILIDSIQQLTEYFTGKRQKFELKLNPTGTEFQKRVWEKVEEVPFGITKSYLDIAIQTGSKKNTRAVGLANGKNPIPIIIPCHRIVGKNGKLTGYSGGLDKKKWLILHELAHSKKEGRLF